MGGGFAGAIGYGLVADTIDYGQWKTGTKSEGVGMATLTFVAKISAGFAGAIIGWINQMFGYAPADAVQSERAIFGLNICFSYLPLVFCVAALLIMLRYDLDRIFPKIQEELEQRMVKNQKDGN